MRKIMTEAEQKRKAIKARKIQKENPGLSLNKIAPKVKVSGSYLSKLLRKFPEPVNAVKSDGEGLQDLVKDVAENMKSLGLEEEETATGYLFFKNAKPSLNIMTYAVDIPAGLKGDQRKLAIFATVLVELGIEEI